jgi:hypothetical protein
MSIIFSEIWSERKSCVFINYAILLAFGKTLYLITLGVRCCRESTWSTILSAQSIALFHRYLVSWAFSGTHVLVSSASLLTFHLYWLSGRLLPPNLHFYVSQVSILLTQTLRDQKLLMILWSLLVAQYICLYGSLACLALKLLDLSLPLHSPLP